MLIFLLVFSNYSDNARLCRQLSCDKHDLKLNIIIVPFNNFSQKKEEA